MWKCGKLINNFHNKISTEIILHLAAKYPSCAKRFWKRKYISVVKLVLRFELELKSRHYRCLCNFSDFSRACCVSCHLSFAAANTRTVRWAICIFSCFTIFARGSKNFRNRFLTTQLVFLALLISRSALCRANGLKRFHHHRHHPQLKHRASLFVNGKLLLCRQESEVSFVHPQKRRYVLLQVYFHWLPKWIHK